MEAALITLGIIVISFALAFAFSGTITLCCNITENRRKKAHPQLWIWFDECNEAGQKECEWHNSKVLPLKRKIDSILHDWDYYSADTKRAKEEELESLRKAHESVNKVYFEMGLQTASIREKIHRYVEEHDLDWARHWGW
jgi:hypothetical protein